MLALYCLDDNVDKKLPGNHFPESCKETEREDDVQSTVFGSVDWESDVSASFKEIRIDCDTTISRNQSSGLASRYSRLTPSNSSATDVEQSVTNTVVTKASQATLIPTSSLDSQTSCTSATSNGTETDSSVKQQREIKAKPN